MNLKLNIYTIGEVERKVAEKGKRLRLEYELTRKTLSERSGVSLASIKRFETTGKVSFSSLLKIANALGNLDDFLKLFNHDTITTLVELEKLENKKKRKRGRL